MGSIFPDQNPVGRPGIDDGHGCSSSIGRGVRATLMPSSSADALLFDLGRVVIDIDFNRAFSRWAGHARCDQKLIRDRFRHDIAYKRHERGETRRSSLPIVEHPSGLIFRTHNFLTGGTPSLSERCPASLNCWPRRREASRCTPLPIPTANTNSTGQRSFPAFSGNFKEVYVSSTIGLRKPEAEPYDYVVKAIGVSADRIVFFDDTLENIEGARARGLQAVHVKSGADLADALAVLTKPRS
jgi:glucose-1-phosphatase